MFITNAWAAESATDGTALQNGTVQDTGHTPEASGAFPPFDTTTFASQLLWLALTFGLLFYLMSKIIIPRVSSILEVRRDRISRDLDEANRMKEESDAAIAAYEQELAEARNNAQNIGASARDKAKAEAEEKRAAADSKLANMLSETEATIAAQRTKALGEVGKIASDTVNEIVSELVGTTATAAEISKAVSAARK
ncbi:MAG: F0F1 ATP synthase subunit B [Nitratireductor sp.]